MFGHIDYTKPLILKFRHGTEDQWKEANPILADREIGVITDSNKVKVGDGATNWNELSYDTDKVLKTLCSYVIIPSKYKPSKTKNKFLNWLGF